MSKLSWTIISDFDGTITNMDSCEYALKLFSTEDWKRIEEQVDAGEIVLQEAMDRHFALFPYTNREVINEIERTVRIRDGFRSMVHYCSIKGFPFLIASAGLDFVVKDMLYNAGCLEQVEVYMPRSERIPGGIRFDYPRLFYKWSRNFKEDLVHHCEELGNSTLYIGDGTPDFPAAQRANAVFSIRNSKLSRLCDEGGILHHDFNEFWEVQREFAELLTSDIYGS